MAHSFPDVLRIFYARVHSAVDEEREHAVIAIKDVARSEAGLLVPDFLRREIVQLSKLGDTKNVKRMQRILSKARAAPQMDRYRYGL